MSPQAEVVISGFHVQLVNRMTNMILFSATTPFIDKSAFELLWDMAGNTIYRTLEKSKTDSVGEFEVRITPLLGVV